MKRKSAILLLSISGLCLCMAEDVIIKAPNYFSDRIRDKQMLFPDSLVYPKDAKEIRFPDVGVIGRLGDYGFTNLRKVTFGNIDYVPGGLFMGNPTIEEIEFDGLVGHFDCSLVLNCPKLRKITFRGPVSSTGGPGFADNCPALDSVVFEGPVIDFGLNKVPSDSFKYVIKCGILNAYSDSLTPKTPIEQIKTNRRMIAELENLAEFQEEVLTAKNPDWMRQSMYSDAKILLPVLQELDSKKYVSLKKAMEYAWNLGDDVKTMLEILKESPAYSVDTLIKPKFCYAPASDSLLSLTHERFNLDSVAGAGDDVSKIKNLLAWVHDNIRHDGRNGLPQGKRNLRNIYDSAKRDSCGYNCRALAISLTEALLSEGIPARYLTCESKKWDSDHDCHVICIAWSNTLGKWIWVDPTFGAYITDEEGNLLHPGEVRQRLQQDLPLILNADANWNHQWDIDKEYYLDEYMAKNLYIMSANTINQAEPEGPANHVTGRFAALVPIGSNYTNANIITTDEAWFWSAPNEQ